MKKSLWGCCLLEILKKKILVKILFFGCGLDFFLIWLRGINLNKIIYLLIFIIFNRDKDDCFKYFLFIKLYFFFYFNILNVFVVDF